MTRMQDNFDNILSDASQFYAIDTRRYSNEFLLSALTDMVLIRTVETKLAWAKEHRFIRGPIHLGVGQEAIAVGVSKHLRRSDRVFGAHRSHSHLLALGADVAKLFAETLGKSSGHSRGMGGSMHLWSEPNGFYGSVPIVAGTVPLAVGAAMAARLSGTTDIAVAYFGDGACEEGIVHESLNLASVQKEPILFVVENNLFASHMHISQRQPSTSTARFALANNMHYRVVDGNNFLAVENATAELVDSIREGNGPGYLEALTYRWYGHVDWREDIDVGVNRSVEDLEAWKLKDPVSRLSRSLIAAGIWSESEHDCLIEKIKFTVDTLWESSSSEMVQQPDAYLEKVYS